MTDFPNEAAQGRFCKNQSGKRPHLRANPSAFTFLVSASNGVAVGQYAKGWPVGHSGESDGNSIGCAG